MHVQSCEFKVESSKFKVQSSKFITGFRVADLGLRIEHPTSAVSSDAVDDLGFVFG